MGQSLCAILLGVFLSIMFFTGTRVNGSSMEPVLFSEDRVFISRFTNFFSPKRGDIVAFKIGQGVSDSLSIKRIVAVPGDSVIIRDGMLYVNGEKEKSDIPYEPMEDYGLARNEITLEYNEYFLLGDNRNNSEDSRYQSVGMVLADDIDGKVWLCFSPDNFGMVK